jgi:hypothetical protein
MPSTAVLVLEAGQSLAFVVAPLVRNDPVGDGGEDPLWASDTSHGDRQN